VKMISTYSLDYWSIVTKKKENRKTALTVHVRPVGRVGRSRHSKPAHAWDEEIRQVMFRSCSFVPNFGDL
jgi:hypothetical protein